MNEEILNKAWEEYEKTGICPACGFNNNGIMRVHNINDDCWLMSNTKIQPLFDKLSPLPIK